MTNDQKLILAHWAKGIGGIGPRLAKRAWWVLQDSAVRPPGGIVGAWANAAEAQQWVLNFHAMGLVGLMDAPRKGRSKKHDLIVNESIARMAELRESSLNQKAVMSSAVLGGLDKIEKEALWRQLRAQGLTAVRSRHGSDLPVLVPDELTDVLCILLVPDIKIIAFIEGGSRIWDQHRGAWIGLPKAKLKNDHEDFKRKGLLEALSLDVLPGGKYKSQAARNKQKLQRTGYMTLRAIRHVYESAQSYPNRVALTVIADVKSSNALTKMLQVCRSNQLWPQSKKGGGVLQDMNVLPYGDSWASAMQLTLIKHLKSASAVSLADLQDALTLRRSEPFCWLRMPDDYEPQGESNWLSRQIE